ncbi:hypothetical protein [Streptomyces sp. CNQ-509]|nr:hypothetical protein [Streptomyces sp. CNQ-509]
MTEAIGAGPGERVEACKTWRNGHSPPSTTTAPEFREPDDALTEIL